MKRKKLKPSGLPPPSSDIPPLVHNWDMTSRSGAMQWLAHRIKQEQIHAANLARQDQHGEPSKAGVPAKRTRRPKKVDSK